MPRLTQAERQARYDREQYLADLALAAEQAKEAETAETD